MSTYMYLWKGNTITRLLQSENTRKSQRKLGMLGNQEPGNFSRVLLQCLKWFIFTPMKH